MDCGGTTWNLKSRGLILVIVYVSFLQEREGDDESIALRSYLEELRRQAVEL